MLIIKGLEGVGEQYHHFFYIKYKKCIDQKSARQAGNQQNITGTSKGNRLP
jgi:hypothetical protein